MLQTQTVPTSHYPILSPRTTGPSYWDWGGEVPSSCCTDFDPNDAMATCDEADAYTKGCTDETETIIQNGLLAIVILMVVIIIFLVSCMIFACCSKKG